MIDSVIQLPIRRKLLIHAGIPLALGGLALFFPLLRELHVDSALIASAAGAFAAAGLSARLSPQASESRALLKALLWIYLPGLVLAAAGVIRGCLTADGVLFWLFNPSMSVFFGFAIARYFRINNFCRPGIWSAGLLAVVAVGMFLIEFFLFPQLYFFNHVWGYWPGPIYDEEVSFTASVLLFRFITLCWAGIFWVMPHIRYQNQAKYLLLIFLAGLMLSYLRLSESGIISPNEYLEQRLGASESTEFAELFYPRDDIPPEELQTIAQLYDFHISELQDTLGVTPGERIAGYMYSHAWQKKQLTGAKYTNYAPVWNPRGQLHLNRQAVPSVLRHELVHVISRDFGNTLLNASWSIGLVEGLAVALAPAAQHEATVDQKVAANQAWPEPEELQELFSIFGFYRQTGPMSYSIAGSFVQYLLRHYPVKNFRRAYRASSLSAGYETPIDSLQAGWKRHLQQVELDEYERQAGLEAFAVPSIFERDCPRSVAPHARALDRYRRHLTERDTSRAITALSTAVELRPDNPHFLHRKAELLAGLHRWADIIALDLPHNEKWIEPAIVRADARKATGDIADPKHLLEELQLLAGENKRAERRIRKRRSDWEEVINVRYYSDRITTGEVRQMPAELQWLWLEQLYHRHQYERLIASAHELQPEYSGEHHRLHLRVAEVMAANGMVEAAQNWLTAAPMDTMRQAGRDQWEEALRFTRYISERGN